MELKDILAISGQSGLYRFVAQSRNGIIVESLATGARSCASAASKVSSMGEIAIFTETDDIPLARVFETIYEQTGGQTTISHKSTPAEIEKRFAEALPDYDRDRVHLSDMKKVIAWYNILVEAGMTEFKTGHEEEETADKDAQ